jgi:hypothetical protein
MAMIALATFIVVADLPHAWTPIKQRILQSVARGRNWRRNSPQQHFDDRAVIVVDPLMKQQLGLCDPPIWYLWPYGVKDPFAFAATIEMIAAGP